MSKRYKYTIDDPTCLTSAQRDFYEKNGYFVVKGLVPETELKRYHERFIDICHRRLFPEGMMTIMKDVDLVKTKGINPELAINKIQDYQGDPVLSSYFHLPQILKYVESFVGKDVAAVHTMLINKPPDPGAKSSRHPLHQDLYYFPFRPADRIVCSWTAMQKVTRKNGCLVVIPGTHKGELLKHGYPQWQSVNKMYHGIMEYDLDESKLVYLEMDPGDTVFFHPILIHGSGSNETTGFRKAISCHYATANTHYIDVRGTVQEPIANEVVNIAEKKFPGNWKIQDIWEMKRVLIQGRDRHQSGL